MHFTIANGIATHYALAGTAGRPRLVLLNSLGSDFRIWQGVVARLAPAFEILCLDGRGHGLTATTPGPYTIGMLADDVTALMDALGWPSASLVGLSVGGLIAQEIATRSPARVERLVLLDTAARIGSAEMWNARIAAVETTGVASISDQIIARWFTQRFKTDNAAAHDGWRAMLERTPAVGYAGTCAALRDADLTKAVAGIAAPTLVAVGAADLSTPPELVRDTAARIRGARFSLIENAGHLPCIEQPDATASLISSHLEGLNP